MPIYIRFEHNKQVETTTLKSKPAGNDWYEAPENFEWQKSYCLTEGGEIAQRTKEDIQKELLDNAKLCAFDNIRTHFNNFTSRFSGHSHQKAKSYEIQAKTAENILTTQESIDEKDAAIIEPLARVRGISVVEMAKNNRREGRKSSKSNN